MARPAAPDLDHRRGPASPLIIELAAPPLVEADGVEPAQQAFLSRVEEVCGPRRPSRSRYKTGPASATWSPSSRRYTASCQILARLRRLQGSPPGHEPSIGARDRGLQAMTASPAGRDGRFAPVREGSNKLLPGAPDTAGGTSSAPARGAWFRDPDGNTLGLRQG